MAQPCILGTEVVPGGGGGGCDDAIKDKFSTFHILEFRNFFFISSDERVTNERIFMFITSCVSNSK